MNLEEHARFLYYAHRNAAIEFTIEFDATISWEQAQEHTRNYYRKVAASFLNYTMIGVSSRLFQEMRAIGP
jgi:hypothetical protein